MPRSAIKRGIAICLLAISGVLAAQPAGNRIIQDATLERADGCGLLTIHFALPMQYVSHFPTGSGQELRIQLKPLGINRNDMPALGHNEPILVADLDKLVPLQRIDYEGQYNPNAPVINLVFDATVHFDVQPGADFRSIRLLLSRKPLADCPIKP